MKISSKLFLILCSVTISTPRNSIALFEKFFKKKIENPPIECPCSDKIGLIKIIGKVNLENVEMILKKIIAFAEDPQVKGVLLATSSEGGNSAITELIFRELQLLSMAKPTVTLVINDCLSGGYKIATGTNWIIAQAASSMGSIGSISVIERHKNSHINRNGYEADISYEIIQAGKFKALDYPESPALSDEERAYLQADMDATYKVFYTLVAQQRNLPLEKLSEWADGKIFTGEKALELGLIDQIGGYSDAIKKLQELIKERGIPLDPKWVFREW